MQKATLFLLAAVIAVALAEGQFYVPRAYYTIDVDGHESLPVPLRRLRRNIAPPSNYPWSQGGAGVSSGACTCKCTCPGAGASAGSGAGGPTSGGGFPGNYPLPGGHYGSSNPNAKRQ